MARVDATVSQTADRSGTRITFNGQNDDTLVTANFTNAPFMVRQGASLDNFGNTVIQVRASDTAADIAMRIEAAIDAAGIGIDAVAQGGNVIIEDATGFSDNSPLSFDGVIGGSGTTITGLAAIGNTLYGVSNGGSLYQVTPGSATPLTLLFNDNNIQFSGLTAGPQNVEGGRYSQMLFATALDGTLYAFNTAGELQPIFLDGATSIATGQNLNGLAFSTLDYNLWHVTKSQGGGGALG